MKTAHNRSGENGHGVGGAVSAWIKLLKKDGVLLKDGAEKEYAVTSVAIPREISAVLFPRSAGDISEILKIARKYRAPVYPVNRFDFGFASTLPLIDGAAVIDLSRMNRILDFDKELGLVTIEPGVTKVQLAAYLEKKGYPYIVPNRGGVGAEGSAALSALERCYSVVPFINQFAALTAVESVLPDGEIYRRAWGGGGSERQAFKWGIGPYLDGLFTQGNFGIPVKVTLALAPVPESIETFSFDIPRDEDLEPLIDPLREIFQPFGKMISFFRLADPYRVLVPMMPSPFNPDAPSSSARASAGFDEILAKAPAWQGMGSVFGNEKITAAACAFIKDKLESKTRGLTFLSPRTMKKIGKMLPKDRVEAFRDRHKLYFSNQLNDSALWLCYWKSGKPVGGRLNPDRDGCGFLHYMISVVITKESVREFADMAKRITAEHRIARAIHFSFLTDTFFIGYVALLFDRNDSDETARAHRCFDDLFQTGISKGFPPFRAPSFAVDSIVRKNAKTGSMALTDTLKSFLDPEAILAPGKYAGFKGIHHR